MPRIFRAFILLCAAVGLSASVLMAQTPAGQSTSPQLIPRTPEQRESPQLVPRTPEQRERAYESNRLVSLHVVVTDASGKPVAGLRPDDFTVLDHGQPQKVDMIEEVNNSASGSTRGLVVLDAINGGKQAVDRVRKELIKLLGQGSGPLAFPLQIVLASDAGTKEGQLTTDRNVLTAELAQLPRNIHSSDCDLRPDGSDVRDSRIGSSYFAQVGTSQGRWDCMNFHFRQSLNALNGLVEQQQKANTRAIVIWTGPGWPLPRQFETGQILPGGGVTGNLSAAIIALESGMQQGRVTLDAVSWGRFERASGVRRTGLRGSLPLATLPEQEASLELPSLAEQSGGLELEKSKDLAAALSTCLGDGEQYYSIAFDPAPATAADEYRTIEVKVDRMGATVRTLTGYYAQP